MHRNSIRVWTLFLIAALVTGCTAWGAAPETTEQPVEIVAAQPQPPTVVPESPSEATAGPGSLELLDCGDAIPFAPGCLDQPRPQELGEEVAWIGALPSGPIGDAVWDPDGRLLAYSIVNSEEGAYQGLEVRSLPDYRLESRWMVPGAFALTWLPSGEGLVFAFDRGDTISIGLARMGEHEWVDLLPDQAAHLAVGLSRSLGPWLDHRNVSLEVGCGTGCRSLYALDVEKGLLVPLVNTPGRPEAPYASHFATVYRFSPDHRFLAATSWGRGLPEASILPWPGPDQPIQLSVLLDGRATEAQSWVGEALAIVAYPPGDPTTWPQPVRPDLYLWPRADAEISMVQAGVYRVSHSPRGNLLAALLGGEPASGADGSPTITGSVPHLALLSWPELDLLGFVALASDPITDVFELRRDLPDPVWLVEGDALAVVDWQGKVHVLHRDGSGHVVLEASEEPAVPRRILGNGANGDLALLVGNEVWLVRVPVA